MRIIVAFLAWTLFSNVPSFGQLATTGAGKATATVVAAYVGPADIVASPTVCYALRACSNALANAGATTTAAVDVLGATTATSCTIYLLGNGTGGLDLTTAGAGAVGHQCLLGATTFCTSTNTSCTVSKIYDQINAHNLSQATAASQPTLTFNCINTSLPCLTYVAGQLLSGVGTASNISQPYTISSVALPGNTASATNAIFTQPTDLYEGTLFESGPVYAFYAGGTVSRAATISAWHSLQAIFNGASSTANVDNSLTSGNAGTTNFEAGASHPWYLGQDALGQALVGNLTETILWGGVAFTTTQQTNLCHNQFSYWGTGTSC